LKCYHSVRRCAGGAGVDFQTYRLLLAASVRNSDMVQAGELYRALIEAGYEPNCAVYSAMIRGFCAGGDLEEAMRVFQEMRLSGIGADASLINALLEGCAKRSMVSLADTVLAEMDASGVLPSNQTLAILLRLYGRSRDLGRSLKVFEDMPKRYGLEINAHAYTSLVSVCLGNGRLDLALEAFQKMKRAGYGATVRTYESLIMGSLRHGDLDNAVGLVDDALGLEKCSREALSSRRVNLDPKLVEDVLLLIGRRRQVKRLGVPLLERLQASGLEVCSEEVVESVLRSAELQCDSPRSPLESRRAERQSWRDFSLSPPLSLSAVAPELA